MQYNANYRNILFLLLFYLNLNISYFLILLKFILFLNNFVMLCNIIYLNSKKYFISL